MNSEVVVVTGQLMNTLSLQFVSTYSPEELGVFAEQLYTLRAFLEKNPQLFAVSPDQARYVKTKL